MEKEWGRNSNDAENGHFLWEWKYKYIYQRQGSVPFDIVTWNQTVYMLKGMTERDPFFPIYNWSVGCIAAGQKIVGAEYIGERRQDISYQFRWSNVACICGITAVLPGKLSMVL